MKLTFIYFSSIFIFLTSCGSVKDKVEEHFDIGLIVSDSSKVELYSYNEQDTSELIIDYQYFKFDSITLKAHLPYQDSVNQLIVNFIENITSFESLDTTVKISSSFFDDALMKFANEYNTLTDDYKALVWYFEASSTIKNDFRNFCQVSNWNWSYTGGAHGNGFTEFHHVDKITGKELFLEDFVSDILQLTAITNTIFRETYDMSMETDLQEEGYWFDNGQFKLTENFQLTDSNFVFVYNTYEIAPYSAGSIVVEVPLKRVKPILKIKL